jgi:Pyruvate/2-oxoacid:ferredoxin oxidoreductase gamma subunit
VRRIEIEMMLTGVGGQGLQLIAKALALTALGEDRHVQLSSEYGGAMRGGHSLATVVVGDAPLRALPVVPAAATALALHRSFWEAVEPRLRPGALVIVNSSLFEDDVAGTSDVVRVPATELAAEVATPMAAGFVLLGAFVAVTELVALDRLEASIEQVVPPYRRQHIEANQRALRAGAAAVAAGSRPLWGAPTGAAMREVMS